MPYSKHQVPSGLVPSTLKAVKLVPSKHVFQITSHCTLILCIGFVDNKDCSNYVFLIALQKYKQKEKWREKVLLITAVYTNKQRLFTYQNT